MKYIHQQGNLHKKIRVFFWGIEPPRLIVSQDTFQASLPNCSSSENKSNLLMQFFLFHSLSARSLQNKASFSCTQSGTTSTSLPGHPILCIPSYWDVQLVAGYTEVRTVLWVSCGLDQLSHHISIGTILVTAVHRDEEWQHWLVCATPQEELHPKFHFHGSHPPLLTSTHLKKVLLSFQLHFRETQTMCCGVLCTI